MSDVDSMRAMRIGPRSERNPRLDEVDTILLRVGATKRDNAHGHRSFPGVRQVGLSPLPPDGRGRDTIDDEHHHTSIHSRSATMRTLGVEEEMLLVDVRNGRPRSVSGQVLMHATPAAPSDHAGPEGSGVGAQGAVEGEFQQQQIETHTPPVADLDTLRTEDRRWRAEAVAPARRTGSHVAALPT
jgi:hypothetical protein